MENSSTGQQPATPQPIMQAAQEPFTAVVRRRIKPGMEKQFEKLMEQFIGFVLQQPGHIGIYVVRPEHGSRDYTIVDRFVNEQARHAFTSLPEYHRWRDKLLEVSDGEPTIQEMGGLAAWFSLPDQSPQFPPPKYKMAVVTFLGVYPLSMIFPRIVGPFLKQWPWWGTGIIVSALIVSSLTWFVMPALTRLFEKWLYYSADKGKSHDKK